MAITKAVLFKAVFVFILTFSCINDMLICKEEQMDNNKRTDEKDQHEKKKEAAKKAVKERLREMKEAEPYWVVPSDWNPGKLPTRD